MAFWNFVNNPENENEVELRIEGDIVCGDDAWLYEWFGIQVASKNTFRLELAKHKGKDIVLWVDSDGGDVFAATGMYNALMEHKKDGAKVTSKIDGRAMSAATIPPMAADERLVSPGSLCMVHNPLTGVRGYASDLRKTADVLDEVKEAIINAYQLGTGRSRDEISQMMDNETYMSARTAITEGFATGMLYTDKQASEPIENTFIFSRQLSIQNSVTDSMKQFFEKYGKTQTPPVATATPPVVTAALTELKQKESGSQMEVKDIKNLEELRQHLPELCNQLETSAQATAQAAQVTAQASAQTAERDRIKAIDEISALIDPALVAKAKYDEPITAEALAFQAFKANAAKGETYVATRATEITASGAAGVAATATAATEAEQEAQLEAAIVNRVAASANQKRKGATN